MNILLCLSHSIEEYDQLRLLTMLGHNVASIGGYIDPAHPHVDIRPPLDIPMVQVVKDAVDALGTNDNLGNAQERIPDAILDWADVIVFHHYLERLYGQWDETIAPWLARDSAHRVIWRTVGQSVTDNELAGAMFRKRGLEIVRYSPREANIPGYAGEDALIRFYKDPADWFGWTGQGASGWDPRIVVGNVTQSLRARDPWTNYGFWGVATNPLPRLPAGPGSETHGGLGELTYDEMRQYLRDIRCYLYTGTQPASYTLGLIEAMMTGVPVLSMGADHFGSIFGEWEKALFEGPDLTDLSTDDPIVAMRMLAQLLEDDGLARSVSITQRNRALELFGLDVIAPQWEAYLK